VCLCVYVCVCLCVRVCVFESIREFYYVKGNMLATIQGYCTCTYWLYAVIAHSVTNGRGAICVFDVS
jgi:hypothetical protein